MQDADQSTKKVDLEDDAIEAVHIDSGKDRALWVGVPGFHD